MSRTNRPLKSSVGLQVKVEIIHSGDALVDNRSCLRVGSSVRIGSAGWIETGMMALATDSDGDLGAITWFHVTTTLKQRWELDIDDLVVLTLRYTCKELIPDENMTVR
jgi:hypothetical protein